MRFGKRTPRRGTAKKQRLDVHKAIRPRWLAWAVFIFLHQHPSSVSSSYAAHSSPHHSDFDFFCHKLTYTPTGVPVFWSFDIRFLFAILWWGKDSKQATEKI
jgi:hypothetical protein